jgi:SMC interacting uncharacterized protein involved in chromosome segregation
MHPRGQDEINSDPLVKNEETEEIKKRYKKITSDESEYETVVSKLADQLREVLAVMIMLKEETEVYKLV